jgi:Immunity protein 35
VTGIDRAAAVERAVELLAADVGPELDHPQLGRIVVRQEQVTEHDIAWAVPFTSATYLRTGHVRSACAPSVIVVPKDGAPAFLPPSHLPVLDFLDEVRDGAHGWRHARG